MMNHRVTTEFTEAFDLRMTGRRSSTQRLRLAMTLAAVLPFPAFEYWTNHCLMTDDEQRFRIDQVDWYGQMLPEGLE